MPHLAPLVAASLIGAGSAAASGIISSKANKNAQNTQAQTADKTLEYEKQKDAEERAYRDKVDAQAKAQFDAKEAMRAPYRQASNGLLASEMARLGISLPSSGGSADPLIAQPRTLADLAGTGTVVSKPLDATTSDPYNTRYSEATGVPGRRRLNMPSLRLSDIMNADQGGLG
jgi:hypothetical protein